MNRPSILKAIEADYFAWLTVVVPIVLWGFYLFLWLSPVGGPDAWRLWIVVLLITIVGAIFLFLRYTAICSHFAQSVEVPGVIERYMHLQDIGRVRYTFTYLKKDFTATNYIHHSTRTMHIETITQIKVMLNPAKPQSALIKDLYFPSADALE
jgi:hypothetical protein